MIGDLCLLYGLLRIGVNGKVDNDARKLIKRTRLGPCLHRYDTPLLKFDVRTFSHKRFEFSNLFYKGF